MKLVSGSQTTDTSFVDRLNQLLTRSLAKIGFKRAPEATARERYEAAIDSSTITPEQRHAAIANAAADPSVKAALDEADRAFEQYSKGSESGELHSRPITPGS
jgi:hypothetical protein